MLIEWTEKLDLGIEEIDTQHKSLADCINRLHHLYITSSDPKELEEVLKFLETYVAYHFNSEEKRFEKNGYPDLETHKKGHREFERTTSNFVHTYQNGHVITDELFTFLHNWFISHVGVSDKKVKNYLV